MSDDGRQFVGQGFQFLAGGGCVLCAIGGLTRHITDAHDIAVDLIGDDPLFEDAARLVVAAGQASASM